MAKLSPADRNLTTALVMGVLRRQLQLEQRLIGLLTRPDAELASPVATALRMGAFQLLHMDRIPAHAALSESVELVRAAGHPGAAGMVNAVLRRLIAAGEGERKQPLVESVEAMAERLGHPGWMVARWVRLYGRRAAEAICAYDLEEPQAGGLFSGESTFAMDEGSRLIAELAAASRPAAKRVWDACAAPGGKTAVLAARLPEAEVLATDISPPRLDRLERRLATVGQRVRTRLADASQLPADEGLFDLVLCDAPCSGTGTLARNPEIKVRLEEQDLARQAERQRRLVSAALERLAPGGRLLFSTCSLEPEENEAVVEAVVSGGAARVLDLAPVLDAVGRSGARVETAWIRNGCLRTLPGANFAGDGFFAALLERA